MAKKNYLTPLEQEVWRYISEKEIVDNQLLKSIFPEMHPAKRNKILYHLARKRYLHRAQKDLYFNPLTLQNYYQLAQRIKEGYIGLGSALHYYNLLDYEDFTIYIITKNYRKKRILMGTQYTLEFIPLGKLYNGFEQRDGLYFSSLEKTLVDCLQKPRLVGFSVLTKALHDAHPNWHKFIGFCKQIKTTSFHQRTGYLLDLLKTKTKMPVPEFIFEFLLQKVKHPVKLVPDKAISIFNHKWKIQDNLGERHLLSWWI